VGPGFDLEQEQVRARREIEAGDRDADIRDRVVRIFREGSGCWGYRTVWARLRREGVRASEKRVARVMREEGLEVVYNRRRARGYSSYAGEVSKAPENLVNRNLLALI